MKDGYGFTDGLRGALGGDILRTFEAYDFLESVGDDQGLMNMRLRFAPDICLEQQCEPSDQGWRVVAAQLRRTRGLCYSGIKAKVSQCFQR